ncbi:MAG: alpha-ketoacid dehydrogenase subunit beta, partial [Candidatus Andersenbacteria bacterium]|nr:alpha-ketoacid dehydrogenase subunit beta [Candidatus Andersenbacteria bacterium]
MQNSEPRILSAAQAILEATSQAMADDPHVIIIGEGVPDPKGIFGTTLALRDTFGSARVWDMPVSENGLTGVCIGAAISGMRPILTHQRVDFSLLSLDQIINNAAKWHYMFGGQVSVPLVIRMVIGHGWGQGAQHSQNLQALFAHIPGLKVVMPASPYDAKGLLASAIHDNNPVIFLEHRWIHGMKGEVPADMYRIAIGKARRWHVGDDITIVSSGYMTVEALRASHILAQVGIMADLIDLRSIKPWDKAAVL